MARIKRLEGDKKRKYPRSAGVMVQRVVPLPPVDPEELDEDPEEEEVEEEEEEEEERDPNDLMDDYFGQ